MYAHKKLKDFLSLFSNFKLLLVHLFFLSFRSFSRTAPWTSPCWRGWGTWPWACRGRPGWGGHARHAAVSSSSATSEDHPCWIYTYQIDRPVIDRSLPSSQESAVPPPYHQIHWPDCFTFVEHKTNIMLKVVLHWKKQPLYTFINGIRYSYTVENPTMFLFKPKLNQI